MATSNGPGENEPGRYDAKHPEDDLERRKRELEAKIAARRPVQKPDEDGPRTGGMAGLGYALRLSSEFVAGVVVGAVIGWIIDRLAGTTPWGMIVFLLLGFCAGVLNTMRSAGLVAEHRIRKPGDE